ncbi:MAG TPA: DUF1573 domain-containing protein [Flavobacterium sp.]|nr:DUF1573 domain-containing protein [Flavobacterium sp.]
MIKFYIKTCFTILILTFLISCNQKQQEVDIFVNEEINLGIVSKEDTVNFNIDVINPTDKNLIIKNTSSSCGCTLISVKDSIVKPNQKTELKIEFIPSLSGGKGNVEKVVVLETNSPKRFHEIIIKAKVE